MDFHRCRLLERMEMDVIEAEDSDVDDEEDAMNEGD